MTHLLLLDTETDSPEPLEASVVTLTLSLMNGDGIVERTQTWMFDFGGEMPAGAEAVHGISTAQMRAEGLKGSDRVNALARVHDIIAAICSSGETPLTLYNASFDLTLLEAERRRLDVPADPIHYWDGTAGVRVFDAFVAWKLQNRYLKGKRTLTAAAQHFGVDIDESKTHAADYDCWLTGQVTLRLLQKDPFNVGDFAVIHKGLALAKAEQSASLEAYFRKSGKTEPDGSPIVCDTGWPLHSALTTNQDPRDAQGHANLSKEAA